jgi:hypothetical protein
MSAIVVVDPDCSFERLRSLFSAAGWRMVSAADHPIIPGEPEHAVFERGEGERAHYTFNPVCRLRVLELGDGVDPSMRAALPLADAADVESWLEADDERTLLRGVLAARLVPDPRHAPRLEALRDHPRAAIALAAARASEELRASGSARADAAARATDEAANDADASPVAREAALAIAEVLEDAVRPLLEALTHDGDGSILASLRPRPEDYERAFIPEVADRARAAYESIWADPAPLPSIESGSRIESYVAPAGMLASDNELSRHFPGGYRAIAHLLDPHRVWVRWKYVQPGESAGRSFDGLVWLDDHWAWFPKPYRALAA